MAKRHGDQITWNPRFLQLRGHYAFHATACTSATPREKGSTEGAVRHTKHGFWPAHSFGTLAELDRQYADWRERYALPRRHASGHFIVAERLAVERETARPLPPAPFDYAGRRSSRVPLDGYLKHRGSFYRAPEALVHQRVELRFDRDGSGSATGARRWPPTSAAMSPGSGSRRRGCGPSRHRRSSGLRSKRPRSRRPSSLTTPNSAHECRHRKRGPAAALPDLEAEDTGDR